ncbi:MAG TPA: DUF5667 domain-containing protein [Chloroflexota bacterium]|jgi:hypothetical protein
MPPTSAELLTRRLDDVLAGLATLEDCLAADPAQAAELRGLVEVVRAIAPPPPVTPDPAFRRRARVALVEAMAAGRSPAAGRARLRSLAAAAGGLIMPPRNHLARAAAPALFVALLLVLAAGGAVDASQDALPGDTLYPVKLGAEEVRLALAADDEARARVHLELASRRADEIEQARAAGRTDAVATATDAFAEHVGSAERLLTSARDAGRDVGALADLLAASSARETVLPARAGPGTPGPAVAGPTETGPAAELGRLTAGTPGGATEAPSTPTLRNEAPPGGAPTAAVAPAAPLSERVAPPVATARPASPSGSGGEADPSSGRRPIEAPEPPTPGAEPSSKPIPPAPTVRLETRGSPDPDRRATPPTAEPAEREGPRAGDGGEREEEPVEQRAEPVRVRAPAGTPSPAVAPPAPAPAGEGPGPSAPGGSGGEREGSRAGSGGGEKEEPRAGSGGEKGQPTGGSSGGGGPAQSPSGDNGGGRPPDEKSSKRR